MSPVNFPKIYNPANQSREELIDNFVVRTKIFEEIFQDIKNSPMQYPEQPYIIQGIRGQGKTTLLLRIAYEIQNDPELSKRLIPVIFNEEQYNITRLFKLWETTAEHLDLSGATIHLAQNMQQQDQDEDYEKRCFALLEKELQSMGKRIVLFIDNIDDLLYKFSKKEHHRLREIFTESPVIRVIGASSVSLEFHYDYGQPFYQFFKMPLLRGLSTEETKTLLLKLGERYQSQRVQEIIEKQPGRVEALRRLTGGVIRTIILLFEIFVDDQNGNAYTDLEKILDSVTPLYKHRMDFLPPQQQEIVDAIALSWDAVSTGEIAKKTRLPSKVISAQVKQLEKYHLIEQVKTGNKNHLYRIAERFFNIWYLMRHGRKWDEKRVRFLVEFLQIWCDQQELTARAEKHLSAVKSGKLCESHALFLTEALARTSIDRRLQHDLLSETKSFLANQKSELKDFISASDYELSQISARDLDSGKTDQAIEILNKIKHKKPGEFITLGILYAAQKNMKKSEESFLLAVKQGDSDAMFNLALLYDTELKDFAKAEKYYRMAIEKEHAFAMFNLALLYQTKFKDFAKAEKYYLVAVGKDDVRAMTNLAFLYQTEFKDFAKAEKYYLMAVKKEETEAIFNLACLYHFGFRDFAKAESYYLLSIEKEKAEAMHNLAFLYETEFKNIVKAQKYYLMAVEKGLDGAMHNLALLYQTKLKDVVKAEKYYLMAVEKDDANAMNNLALLYQIEFKDFAKAEKYYLMAVEKESVDAMYNLALLYQTEFKDLAKAEKYYLMAVEKEHDGAMNNLALLYQTEFNDSAKAEKYYLMAVEKGQAEAIFNLALLYDTKFRDFAKAEKYYLMAVEKEHADAMFNLALLYQTKFKDFAKAEKYYFMAVEQGQAKAMNNLGLLYKTEFEDFTKAEKYYLKAVEKGQVEAMNNLAWLYFNQKIKKIDALEYAKTANQKKKNINYAHTLATILLWNDEIDQAIQLAEAFLTDPKAFEQFPEEIGLFIMLLIAKKQYHSAKKLFDESEMQLKERFKPVYYALMHFMQKEFPNEYLKMGGELKETVEEIIERIKGLEKDYSD